MVKVSYRTWSSECHQDTNGVDEKWFVSGMKMGTLTTVKTTCARVILMALTGDGSMSTNCCTELRVWHTRRQAPAHPPTHTHAHESSSASTQTHEYKEGLMEKKFREKC